MLTLLAPLALLVSACGGTSGPEAHATSQSAAESTPVVARVDPLKVCFDSWNAAANDSLRSSLPADPIVAVVQSLPDSGDCGVSVYARPGGILAYWFYSAQRGIYTEGLSGMPGGGEAKLSQADAATVSSTGFIHRTSNAAFSVVSTPSPVGSAAAGCMFLWNDSSKNSTGLQLAAGLASSGHERATVGLAANGDCIVVLGDTYFLTALIWETAHGYQETLGSFYPEDGGQGVAFSNLDPNMIEWNGSVHPDGCISPGASPLAACPQSVRLGSAASSSTPTVLPRAAAATSTPATSDSGTPSTSTSETTTSPAPGYFAPAPTSHTHTATTTPKNSAESGQGSSSGTSGYFSPAP